jgi:hypothetical protein
LKGEKMKRLGLILFALITLVIVGNIVPVGGAIVASAALFGGIWLNVYLFKKFW